MDLQSALQSFAEAWVAANTPTPLTAQFPKPGICSGRLTLSPWDVTDENKDEKSETQAAADVAEFELFEPAAAAVEESLMSIRCSVAMALPGTESIARLPEETMRLVSIPASCRVSDVVKSALLGLGYSLRDTVLAKGAIQIDNWKPVALNDVTDDPVATLSDIVGKLIGVCRLNIVIASELGETTWSSEDVRIAVIELLKVMPQSKLAKLAPLTQPIISNLTNRKVKLSKARCSEFGNWYARFIKGGGAGSVDPDDVTAGGVRNTFSSTNEVPRLKRWYSESRCPCDEKLERYAAELNRSPLRAERPKITVEVLRNWWKNERQRLRLISIHGPRRSSKRRRLDRQASASNQPPLPPAGDQAPADGADASASAAAPAVTAAAADAAACCIGVGGGGCLETTVAAAKASDGGSCGSSPALPCLIVVPAAGSVSVPVAAAASSRSILKPLGVVGLSAVNGGAILTSAVASTSMASPALPGFGESLQRRTAAPLTAAPGERPSV